MEVLPNFNVHMDSSHYYRRRNRIKSTPKIYQKRLVMLEWLVDLRRLECWRPALNSVFLLVWNPDKLIFIGKIFLDKFFYLFNIFFLCFISFV